ncbi:G2/mitotic-specific cyclin-B-like [Biomphalaria glabrata]|uniref:G2/mitotic-specific cyclin-B-like n=1 Tax=Biomphalaria glabrata TaxID=6526 RepID=A0A2C9JJU0_BIOGL|nr:G2/mitotic-specific cyclin-B-like [Biomphalaria glabrata]
MTTRHLTLPGMNPKVMEADLKMKFKDAGSLRLTLGEIGNRVSAIQIDATKGGAFKKDILQPDGIVTRAKAKIAANKPINFQKVDVDFQPIETNVFATKNDTAPVKVEYMPGHNLLPSALRMVQSDIVFFDGFGNHLPMDISDDGEGPFSKAGIEAIEDIDAVDIQNPQLVSIYVKDIYNYMRYLEQKYTIRPKFLEGTDLTGKMRAILIDWLCQVHTRFRLLQETLYLTVAIIDRYLQQKPISRQRLQLLGVSAMLVASKYEEQYAPEVADFVYITDNAYTKQDVREMEQDILKTLEFGLGRPHGLHFLRRFSKAGNVDPMKHTLAKYLMELSIIEYDMAHLRPSHLAAAALYLSITVLDNSPWTATLKHYSKFEETELKSLSKRLAQLVVKAETSKLTAIKTKFASTKFMKISSIPQLKSQTMLDMAESIS